MYASRDVPGKGKGLIAVEKILKGTRILCEEPIIKLPQGEANNERLRRLICDQVDALGKSQRQAFLSMHNIHAYNNPAEQYFGIVRTIALPIESGGVDGGIFLEACRINHACNNNAQKDWNENINRHTVHALRDIDEGEEITIYYLGTDMSYEARNKKLRERFGFTCSCHLCSLPPQQRQESDERLKEINRLDTLISQGGLDGILSFPLRTLRYVDRQVHLYEEQGPGDAGLSRAYFDAAQIAIANGDLARGRIFVERAMSGWRTAGGSDCKMVLEHGYLEHDPSKFNLYGMSKKWGAAGDEVPLDLEPGGFEDWLWKRPEPQCPGKPANLRNRATFPGFDDLPGENVIELDFFEDGDMGTSRPRRHWCFLAEIVNVIQLLRLQFDVSDVDGKEVPLIFYTDRRGDEVAPAQAQKKYTVAVLYAQRRAFKFDKPGIRLEDIRNIKIFPVSLHNLLAMSDSIQKLSTEINGCRICHGCGKKGASLRRCAKCSFFWYCNTNCQAAGWNEKGHKADCKILKDPDLQGLFHLNWNGFDEHVQFSLKLQKD